jgi:hypothetical protein
MRACRIKSVPTYSCEVYGCLGAEENNWQVAPDGSSTCLYDFELQDPNNMKACFCDDSCTQWGVSWRYLPVALCASRACSRINPVFTSPRYPRIAAKTTKLCVSDAATSRCTCAATFQSFCRLEKGAAVLVAISSSSGLVSAVV